jgi:N-methylhydantoinase A
MSYRISVDTGGTFTDMVVLDPEGQFHVGKALTTPDRISEGMFSALEVAAGAVGREPRDLLAETETLIYGTTRATNAIVTKQTARTAFLTTTGFRDILVFKEGGKHGPHDYSYDYPQPYIPRRHTFEIDERIGSAGEIVTPLDEAKAREDRQ